ncbi:hypothetical protein LCGC14_0624220 [marine sediment metagenome]|uniref:Uncharacterized protein n=1 Tax=marine sediment metagenome TaxID=412755 RepID=A0A0F9R932_9ZZZZ
MLHKIKIMGMDCFYHTRLETSDRTFNSNYYIKAGRMSITKKADEMPGIYRKNYLAVVSGKASPRNAVKAFCIECMGYNRAEVTNCDTIECPLNLYRPYRKAGDSDE